MHWQNYLMLSLNQQRHEVASNNQVQVNKSSSSLPDAKVQLLKMTQRSAVTL
jgi:hypothetical protein